MSYRQIKRQLGSQRAPLMLEDFTGGLVSSIPVQKLKPYELSSCVNFKLSKFGGLETRAGITKYNSTAFADKVVAMNICNIGGTNYELFACRNKNVYYLDSNSDPVMVTGTLNSTDVQILGYNDIGLFLDGGVIKYWDGTGDLKLAYDDGTGTRGFQFDNSDGDDDGTINLDGTPTSVAYKFTSTAWDSGWTIDPTKVSVKLSKHGNPTGNVTAEIRLVSGNSLCAEKTLVASSTVTSGAAEYDITFDSGDITTSMSPSTEYYCVVTNSGTATDYIKVHYTTTTSGNYSSYVSSWTDDSTKDPIISLKPGAAPKGNFAAVKTSRLYVAGDPDNTGYIWYSNLTHLDWSTTNGGGWIGSIDAGKNSFAVGAIIPLYANLYIIGKSNQPYLSKLTGDSPSDYKMIPLFLQVSTIYKTMVSTNNNLFFCSEAGVDSIRGVETYGDIRTFPESDAVKDRIDDYWDEDAFAGYNHIDGQYWLKLSDYSKVLVCHTKQRKENTQRCPWVEYRFFNENLSDTDSYIWNTSASGTNEFYVTTTTSGDPSILEPTYLMFDDTEAVTDTLGSLVDSTWAYGDNDSLGFSTVYVCLADAATVAATDISTVLDPTTFASWGDKMFVACDDKNVYYQDPDVTDDAGSDVRYNLSTAYFTVPWGYWCLRRYHLNILSEVGGMFSFKTYANRFSMIAETTTEHILAIADSLTVNDLDVLVQDANFSLDSGSRISEWLNMNVESFMFSLSDFSVNGKPIHINSIITEIRAIQP